MSGRRVVVVLTPDDELVRRATAPGWAEHSERDAEWTGVAVDVLRATTTLTVALANGAAGVVPFADPAEARAFRDRSPEALACGEREGRIVDGFDLGNSPFEYTRARVAGKTLAFASTNGSRAMLELRGCGQRLLGAFVNSTAIVRACSAARLVRIVCAGKEGGPADEDSACAGWIAARLAERGWRPDGDVAARAVDDAPRGADEVHARVTGAEHALYLSGLGPEFARDVEFCAALDSIGAAYEF